MTSLSRRDVCLLVGFGGLAISGSSAATPTRAHTLSDVIERHTLARGGKKILDQIQSQAVEMEILEKGKVIDARYRCDKSPAYRIDIYDGGKHVFCEGLDADGPWIWPGDQPVARQGVDDGKKSGLEGIQFNLYGLHAFPQLGNKLSLDGREQISGVNYYVVRVDLRYGNPAYLYIDPQTWMISRRREIRAFHPDMDLTKRHLETQYSDFRLEEGVQNSHLQHQVDLGSGDIAQVIVIKKMKFNPEMRNGELTRSFEFDKT